jgi:outer membrane scaffolding protein for murein synthesis (MipA/OmpV family)
VKLITLIFTLYIPFAFAQNFNNLANADIADLEVGGGYVAGNKFREEFKGTENDTYNGIAPLYSARVLFFYIGNVPWITNLDAKGFQIGTVSNYTGDSYETDGVDRDRHFFAGGFIGYNWITFYGLGDITGTSHGAFYTLRMSPLIYKGSGSTMNLILKAELTNRAYNQYYYGINETDVMNSQHFSATYSPKETTNYETMLIYGMKLSNKWRFSGWLGAKQFGKEISNSPTVKTATRFYAGIGWLYKLF